jgi:hypothetical protein
MYIYLHICNKNAYINLQYNLTANYTTIVHTHMYTRVIGTQIVEIWVAESSSMKYWKDFGMFLMLT